LQAGGDGGALVGAMLAGVFGLAWALWGATGVAGSAAVVIRVVGIVIGLLIFACSVWLRRSIRRDNRSAGVMGRKEGSGSIFSAAGYRIVVALEVVALFGGGALLGATGHTEYTIAWYAGVVGIHFLVFRPTLLGWVLFAGSRASRGWIRRRDSGPRGRQLERGQGHLRTDRCDKPVRGWQLDRGKSMDRRPNVTPGSADLRHS
jgi:hypothetical protein